MSQQEIWHHESSEMAQALRLPYSANKILSQSLESLDIKPTQRAWGFEKTLLSDEVKNYRKNSTSLGMKGELPSLRQAIEKNHAKEMALKINSSLDLLNSASKASLLAKPIILYYSCKQLCDVYTKAFFHGIIV